MTTHDRHEEVPATWEQALDLILAELRRLMIVRHIKYGPGNIAAFGELGCVVRASDKLQRLRQVILDGVDGYDGSESDDTVEDAWKDLADYGIIALMWRDGTWELPMKPCDDHSSPLGDCSKCGDTL